MFSKAVVEKMSDKVEDFLKWITCTCAEHYKIINIICFILYELKFSKKFKSGTWDVCCSSFAFQQAFLCWYEHYLLKSITFFNTINLHWRTEQLPEVQG